MNFEKTNNGSELLVILKGDLDSDNAPDLEKRLTEELDGVTSLTFDLTDLDYISSAGLRVFLMMQKTMKERGSMEIRNVSDDVMDIFKVTGFVRLLNLV